MAKSFHIGIDVSKWAKRHKVTLPYEGVFYRENKTVYTIADMQKEKPPIEYADFEIIEPSKLTK